MIKVNALGDTCPIPVVKAKNAIKEMNGQGVLEILVDNEIAVQNLTKMANQKGYLVSSEKLEDGKYQVVMEIGEHKNETQEEKVATCQPCKEMKNIVIAVSSDKMGEGNDELGAVLIKGFLYAVSQQETLPDKILFYNGGAKLTCEGSDSLEDLKSMEASGVEILTCGTCLNYYGLTDKLAVGTVTNMYVITQTLTEADLIIKP